MNKRVESLDVFRGLTMVFMLIVDNPGGKAFAPLNHATWNGFTPTDFVFPTFIFVMGVSMYLSLRKQEFRLSWKVFKRFALLFGLGLLCNWIGKCVWNGHIVGVENLRILGVLQRLVDQGNTVLIIEHNLDILKSVDWIIDMGPEGGEKGGRVIAQGTPEEIARDPQSVTGIYLKEVLK